MNTPNLPTQNQDVIEIQVANGEKKMAYRPGVTGNNRSLMIAAYGAFGKDYVTIDDAIQFAENAIIDHFNQIDRLRELKRLKMIDKYSKSLSELEDIVALIKENNSREALPEAEEVK